MIFYCEVCHRNENSKDVGYIVWYDGREVCEDAAKALDTDYDADEPQPLRFEKKRRLED